MRRLCLALAIFLLSPPYLLSQTNSAAVPAQLLEPGKILPSVQCSAHPEQSYALYLPSNYSADHLWPLLISSDPAGRGVVPLELEKEAAERYGFILAASNNSRNGAWQPRIEATDAMLRDMQARVSIDTRRVYFAGFSGGARASSQIAVQCKCAAGVLLSGAGFSGGLSPAAALPFPVFSAVGTLDFNYSEVIPLQDELTKTGYPHWLRTFDGAHQWPPAEVMAEAIVWFRIQAMKTEREPRDQYFIESEFSRALARAYSFRQTGDLLSAWREYGQIVSTYDSLVDTAAVRAKADALATDKTLRDAAKRERSQFEEQSKLTDDIVARMAVPPEPDSRVQADQELQDRLLRLRRNADQETRADRAVVYKRALAGVFVAAMESGNGYVEVKKIDLAVRTYTVATQAKPDSEWAWEQLAVAQALAANRKGAIAALSRARDLARDKAGFMKWLDSEHAFESLRSSPGFQALSR